MRRRDYAFPFRIDPGSRQAAGAGYADHVRQMIRQLLLTTQGERADLPELGCGLRALLFAPHSETLDAMTEMMIVGALNRWLGEEVEVRGVHVATPDEAPDRAQVIVEITYILLQTGSPDRLFVRIGA